MSVTTKQPTQELLDCLCNEAHPFCLACSRAHECSLGLHFSLQEDGSVETRFECCPDFQGYEGLLHGGVT